MYRSLQITVKNLIVNQICLYILQEQVYMIHAYHQVNSEVIAYVCYCNHWKQNTNARLIVALSGKCAYRLFEHDFFEATEPED